MAITIDIPEEDLKVTPTCGTCKHPVSRTGGSVSWACDNERCPTRIIPMFEDARFIDANGTEWVITDDEEWIDVVREPVTMLSLPEDPWLIQYLVDDEDVALGLFEPVGDHAVTFETSRMAEVIACLAGHAENCLMQESRQSAIYIAEVIGDLGTRSV